MGLISTVKQYVATHLDHFLISLGVSIVITAISDVFVYHLAFWLHLFHVPENVIRWMGH